MNCRVRVRIVLILATLAAGVLCNGCFVLTSERRYKPEASSSEVRSLRSGEELSYSRFIESDVVTLEIGVRNSPGTWELGFLFWVLPFPINYDYVATQPMTVDVFVEPKSANVTFDPSKTFFLNANQGPASPGRIFYNHEWFGTNDSRAFPITSRSRFVLEFSLWNNAHPNRYAPFQLRVQGLGVGEDPIRFSPVNFKPITVVWPQFRLPY